MSKSKSIKNKAKVPNLSLLIVQSDNQEKFHKDQIVEKYTDFQVRFLTCDPNSIDRDEVSRHDVVLILESNHLLSPQEVQSLYDQKSLLTGYTNALSLSGRNLAILTTPGYCKKLIGSLDTRFSLTQQLKDIVKDDSFFVSTFITSSEKELQANSRKIKPALNIESIKDNLSSFVRSLKDPNHPEFVKSSFYLFSIFTLITFLFISQFAGISGDEFRHDGQSVKVYEYFRTLGNDKSAVQGQGIDPQHYNAQTFDVILYFIERVFDIDNKFALRHFFNSLLGWFGILIGGLLAARLFGWEVGLLTLFLLFVSPRYFGNVLNNHRDIPVATFYICSLYFTIKYLLRFPKPSKQLLVALLLSIAGAFSIRFASGLLIIGVIGVGVLLHVLIEMSKNRSIKKAFHTSLKHAQFLIIPFVGSIIIGNLLWPFFWEGPLKNTYEVYKASSNIGVSLRQIFEGVHMWSNDMPWYYLPKYIIITTPIIVLLGFLIHLFSPKKIWRKGYKLSVFVLLFATLFPLLFAVAKVKNDYGGWRHFLFIYPSFTILSSLGLLILRDIFPKKSRIYFPLLIVLFSILPIKHIISNSPYQYIYFNLLVGGVNGAHGFYETDYSFNSMQAGLKWVKNNAEQTQGQKIKVVANDPSQLSWAFRKDTANFQTEYTRYYEKYDKDWDYGVFTNSYISAHQLREGIWPPKGTIHSIKVDDVVVTAVIKRYDKRDLESSRLIGQNDYQQGVPLLEAFIAENPNNEEALMDLSTAYYNIGNYPKSIEFADRAIAVYPEAITGFVTKGLSCLNTNQLDLAEDSFRKGIAANANYYPMYYYLALVMQRKNQPNEALRFAEMSLRYEPKYRDAVSLIINIYDQQGMKVEADKYRNYLNSI